MATVPRFTAQVQERGISNQRFQGNAPLEAFGGGERAAGPTQALQQTVSLVDKEREHADKIAVMDADRELADYKLKLMYGSPEQDSGFQGGLITMSGKSAIESEGTLREAYAKKKSEIEKRLSFGGQKAAFLSQAAQHDQDFNASVEKHVFNEMKVVEKQVIDSSLKTYKDQAVISSLEYSNPDASEQVQKSFRGQEKAIATFAAANGWDEKYTAQRVKEVRGETKAAMINRMLISGKDQDAKSYFEANKENFDADTLMRLEKVVNEEATKGDAMRIVDQYTSQGYDLQTMMNKAKDIDSPDVRKEVEQRAKDYSSLKEAAKRQRQDDIYNAAFGFVNKNGGNTNDPAVKQYLLSMDPEDARKIQADAKDIREGKFVVTDIKTLEDLETKAAFFPNEFLKENLNRYRGSIAGDKLEELKKTHEKLRKGDTKATEGIRSSLQIVGDTALKAGIEDKEELAGLRSKVEQEVVRLRDQGKTVGPAEMQQITEEFVIKATVAGSGFKVPFTDKRIFKSRKPIFEVEDGQSVVIDAADIPRGERLKIEESLRKAKIQVTEDTITSVYTQKINNRIR